MVDAVRIVPANLSFIPVANLPWTAIFGGVSGGRITNPSSAADQGISTVEPLFYSFDGPAVPRETGTCFPLQPGQYLDVPAGMTADLSVTAVTTGHRFSAYVVQPAATPTPTPSNFPPDRPTSLLKTIPSYLYVEYQDDDDLQALVRAYNEMAQDYTDWFNQVRLPVYTSSLIAGDLLDWVALGLYGMRRPTLSSGINRDVGPLNTALYNQIGFNDDIRVGPTDITVTTDDIFKRIMTWRLYRGDGKQFNLTWLKRRISRFLNGPNGTDPVITNTYGVSASYASRTQANIILPNTANSTILKEAIDSGAVELPLQLTFSVTIA